jgi:hypothetical protein
MNIHEILESNLHRLYENHSELLGRIGQILEPEIPHIVDTFYAELLLIPEIKSILKNAIVEKNLKQSQQQWIRDFFQPHSVIS